MSGEKSKTSGEIGERLAKAFLEVIGWNQDLRSVSIPCTNSKHKGGSGAERKSHGDDSVFIYNNPFYESRTEVVHVSVKNNLDGYSESEADLRTTLKGFLTEANEIIACAQYDGALLATLQQFNSRKRKEHCGLLIWTSSHRDSAERDVISTVSSSIRLPEQCTKNIYVIDGARINFILKSVSHAKSLKESSFSFFYPDTGLANKSDERHGKFLPLELLVADILPLKIVNNGAESLYLYVNQPFDGTCFTRAIALALSFTGAWCREIKVGFPDFNVAQHQQEAAAAKLPFHERDKSISPFCFVNSNLNALEKF